MRAWQRTGLTMTMVAGLCGLVATSASAQVCGDADGSGSVTVTDGVATLRSAAGLSSACTNATCDVDGSGSVTVSDGVNVLRKAAGITITENCSGGGGSNADVQAVTDSVIPFLTFGLTQVPNVSIGSAAVRPAATEDCEDGGSRTTDQSGQTITVTFDACKVSDDDIGRFQLDGFVRVNLSFPTSTVSFELNITDLDANKLVDFDGSVQGTPRLQGGFVIDGGPISIASSEGGPAILRLEFNDLTVDDDGHILSGSVEAEDVGNNFDIKSAEVEVEDGSTTASLHVVRDDDSEQDFDLNLRTGEITERN